MSALIGTTVLTLVALVVRMQDQGAQEPSKRGLKGRTFCEKCGGQLVVSMPNGQKPRHETLLHLDTCSIRCPKTARYIEQCGFPIGPPYRGRYSRSCVLPKDHAPSSACSLYPLPYIRRACPECEHEFVLVRIRVVSHDKPGLEFATPSIPAHTLGMVEQVAKRHWYSRRRKTVTPARPCPGSGK